MIYSCCCYSLRKMGISYIRYVCSTRNLMRWSYHHTHQIRKSIFDSDPIHFPPKIYSNIYPTWRHTEKHLGNDDLSERKINVNVFHVYKREDVIKNKAHKYFYEQYLLDNLYSRHCYLRNHLRHCILQILVHICC